MNALEATANLPDYSGYDEVKRRLMRHPLRLSEIPNASFVSLALPTQRLSQPGYAFFTAAAARPEGNAPNQQPPASWGVLDARRGRLILYADVAVMPFSDEAFEAVTLEPVDGSLAALRAAHERIVQLIDSLAPAFFEGEAGQPDERRELERLLETSISRPLIPRYRQLAPDFWSWLAGKQQQD